MRRIDTSNRSKNSWTTKSNVRRKDRDTIAQEHIEHDKVTNLAAEKRALKLEENKELRKKDDTAQCGKEDSETSKTLQQMLESESSNNGDFTTQHNAPVFPPASSPNV